MWFCFDFFVNGSCRGIKTLIVFIFIKTLILGNIEGRRRRGQRMRWLDGITDSMDEFEQAPGDSEGEKPGMLQSTGSQRVGYN